MESAQPTKRPNLEDTFRLDAQVYIISFETLKFMQRSSGTTSRVELNFHIVMLDHPSSAVPRSFLLAEQRRYVEFMILDINKFSAFLLLVR